MLQFTTCLVVFLTQLWFPHVVTGGEIHSLTYSYTAFSKPINLPGIHEFTAMGLMDGRMIDYYDSTIKKKVPMQPWMEERLDKDYWDKGTQSRQSKEQWFKVNLGILRDRMRHNDTDLHILQWRHGCEAERQGDNTLKFIKGKDEYSYDGDDYLAFDDANKDWIAPVALALPTKRKWDLVKMLNDYTQGYLERECVSWLSKFVDYGKAELLDSTHSRPPQLYVYGRKCKNPNSIMLHCMATGFYPKEVILNIMRNGQVVDKLDGMQSTDVRPNGDGTFQIKNQVEILRSDSAKYSCEVIHRASSMRKVEDWDGVCGTPDDSGSNIGPVVAVLFVLLLVGVSAGIGIFFMKKKEVGCFSGKEKGQGLAVEHGNEEMENLTVPEIKVDTSSKDSGLAVEHGNEEMEKLTDSNGALNDDSGTPSEKNQDSPTSSSSDLAPSEGSGDSGGKKTSASSSDSGLGKN